MEIGDLALCQNRTIVCGAVRKPSFVCRILKVLLRLTIVLQSTQSLQ